ncbi:hypothetical protein PSEUDO8Z_30102 [Pseudomonas sp. 8Z]|nr:hypothetical protein PSEUDO8Z_30102 [Pseudomonas sp. 8Z]
MQRLFISQRAIMAKCRRLSSIRMSQCSILRAITQLHSLACIQGGNSEVHLCKWCVYFLHSNCYEQTWPDTRDALIDSVIVQPLGYDYRLTASRELPLIWITPPSNPAPVASTVAWPRSWLPSCRSAFAMA